jgi:hypothetical protein
MSLPLKAIAQCLYDRGVFLYVPDEKQKGSTGEDRVRGEK